MTTQDTHRLDGADTEAADAVAALLRGAAPLGVAFSGGVGSSLLLALAIRAHSAPTRPSRSWASRPASPPTSASPHMMWLHTSAPASWRSPRAKGSRRPTAPTARTAASIAKDELFTRMSDEVVAAHGLAAAAYGENADDAHRPDRPGGRAATHHRVLRLADAGLDKLARSGPGASAKTGPNSRPRREL